MKKPGRLNRFISKSVVSGSVVSESVVSGSVGKNLEELSLVIKVETGAR